MFCEVKEKIELEARKEFKPIIKFPNRDYVEGTLGDLKRLLTDDTICNSTHDLLTGLISTFEI